MALDSVPKAELVGSLLDPAIQACPFDYYRQMREHAPVYRMPDTGFFLISNYEDLKTVLADSVTFSNDISIAQIAGAQAADLGRLYDDELAEKGWAHVQTLQRIDQPCADPAHGQGNAAQHRAYL
jgi:cytochrome P450